MSQPIEGTWREDAQDGALPAGPDERPAWLLHALQETGQQGEEPPVQLEDIATALLPEDLLTSSGGLNGHDERPSQQMPSTPKGFSIPPMLRPLGADPSGQAPATSFPPQGRGVPGEPPAGVPRLPSLPPSQFGATPGPMSGPQYGDMAPGQQFGMQSNLGAMRFTPSWESGNGRSPFGGPTSGQGGAPASGMEMAPLGMPPSTGREVQPFGDQVGMDQLGMLVQPLGPGTLLKSGRYRLMQRFHPLDLAYAQRDEPPLMVASDTEVAQGRVLIQELLLNSVRPEDTDTTRRLIAQRLQDLAAGGGMPRLLDHFGERRRHFLVFEMPDGDTLAERLQRTRGPLEESVAATFALQVLEVLENFEQRYPAFIHGNICPANVVIRPGRHVLLVGCSPTLLLHPDGHVEHGAAGGILGYAAPEQVRGQAGMRSDLYSLCATLHHAVTGSAPASRPSVVFQPVRRLNPNASLELEEALGQGLRPAPAQRFQSAMELRQSLMRVASGHGTHVPEALRDEGESTTLAPVRDARGRLVLPRQRATQNPLMVAAIIFMLFLLVGGGTLLTFSLRSNFGTKAAPTPTPNDLVSLFQSQGIALSGGEFIFDTNRQNNDLKQKGARAMAAGDLVTAESDFHSALTGDPSDAEASIYIQDVQILAKHQAYVTAVAAVAFGNDDAGARAELQGIAMAQDRINHYRMLPQNLVLRVLVLNSGASVDGATVAANVLLQQIQRGNAQHLIGIIGWPESEQTQLAISALKPSGLALVSPTATADNLGGTAANFFALAPSDSTQVAALADMAVTQLNARRIMVVSDPADATSAATATTFITRLTDANPGASSVDRVKFTTNVTTDFSSVAQRAAYMGDTVIFLCGSDQDAVYLAGAVTKINTQTGASIHVLADHRVVTPTLLGVGDTPAAGVVRAHPDALDSLLVETLADANEWQRIAGNGQELATFGEDYLVAYGSQAEPYGLQDPDATTILAYDAVRLLAAADISIGQTKGNPASPDPTQIRVQILQHTPAHPFYGVGGALTFSASGRITGKALALDALRPVATVLTGKAAVHLVLDRIIGGTDTFCAKTDCSRVN